MDRTLRLKINKETQSLSDTTDQIDLIYIYRTFHLKAAEYNFFSQGTFFRIDYILDHNSNLSKFKKGKMESSIFSDHNAMRLEINYIEGVIHGKFRSCVLGSFCSLVLLL